MATDKEIARDLTIKAIEKMTSPRMREPSELNKAFAEDIANTFSLIYDEVSRKN